jgi:predicted transcriptional regulator
MNLLWQKGDLLAGEIVKEMKELTGWNKNTTYTILNKLAAKGMIERVEPKFLCRACISKDDIRQKETDSLIDRLFDGSKSVFFSTFLESGDIDETQLQELRRIIEKLS